MSVRSKTFKEQDVQTPVYDADLDTFYIRLKENNYESSIASGDLIIDFNKKKEVIGLEILNATKFFGMSKAALQNIVEGRVKIQVSQKEVKIDFFIRSNVNKKRKQKTTHDSLTNTAGLETRDVQIPLATVN